MIERDILREEIIEAIEHPTRLKRGRVFGRYQAERAFGSD